MTRTARIAGAVLLALAITAPTASAEDFKATYGPGQANATNWEGTVTGGPSVPGTTATGGIVRNGCVNDEVRRCDRLIFTVTAGGLFTTSVDVGETVDAVVPDIDIYLYASDAAGEHDADAEPIASSADFNQVEAFEIELAAGTYVLEVEPYNAVDQAYTATAGFSGFAMTGNAQPIPGPAPAPAPDPAPAPAPAPEPQPAPAAAPPPAPAPAAKPSSRKAKAACTKKARKIKNAKKRKAALKRCAKRR
jgi:hypothetical protein